VTTPKLTELESLALIQFSGEDAQGFLHNQLTCDVNALATNQSAYGSYCTPKGRVLATFLLWRTAEAYFMQLPSSVREPIQKRLSMYVLRAKVKVMDAGALWAINGLSGEGAATRLERVLGAVPKEDHELTSTGDATVIRLPSSRYEILVPRVSAPATLENLRAGTELVTPEHWEWLDIRAGIPTITPATQEQFVPQMLNLDLIGGLSFSKGCYPGQEIVARMHFLGRLKQRTYLATVSAESQPQPGDKLYSADLGSQASGTIVNAARSPEGGYDVLAVIQIASAQSNAVHWKSLGGPALALLSLPYEVAAPA
jgi:tRNA-modifying protein YgfZ